MAAINSNLGSALLRFTFTDENDDVISSFRLNPTDVKLAKRCQEVSEYFNNLRDNTPEAATLDDVVRLNDELEGKICYLLGYDARGTLFGLLSATTLCDDGVMFVVKVMEKIVEAVTPEIQKRKQSMAHAVSKYTAKYQ